ncbi:hypothetical protein JOQ06_027480, partial [Pogonophryne albipinna]
QQLQAPLSEGDNEYHTEVLQQAGAQTGALLSSSLLYSNPWDLGEGEEEQGEPRAGGGQLSQLRASLAEGSLTNFKSLLMSAHRRCKETLQEKRLNAQRRNAAASVAEPTRRFSGSTEPDPEPNRRRGDRQQEVEYEGRDNSRRREAVLSYRLHLHIYMCSLPTGRALFEHRPITSQHVPAPCKLINIPPVFGPLHHPLGDQPSPGPSYEWLHLDQSADLCLQNKPRWCVCSKPGALSAGFPAADTLEKNVSLRLFPHFIFLAPLLFGAPAVGRKERCLLLSRGETTNLAIVEEWRPLVAKHLSTETLCHTLHPRTPLQSAVEQWAKHRGTETNRLIISCCWQEPQRGWVDGCKEASSLCKASRFSPSPTPEGTKEAPVPPLGARGPLTPINPPFHFLP